MAGRAVKPSKYIGNIPLRDCTAPGGGLLVWKTQKVTQPRPIKDDICMLTGATILITGGTGSFGHTFLPMTLARYDPKKVIVFSRDEMKQWEMAKLYGDDPRVRFFIGDVRDRERVYRAFDRVDLRCACRRDKDRAYGGIQPIRVHQDQRDRCDERC